MLPIKDPQLINYIKRRIIIVLVLVNNSIFILAGLLGYMLAGRTLKPIKDMVDEQNRFVSDASHEFRTPLTVLKSTLEVNLRDKNLTLAQAKNVIAGSVQDVNTLQSLSDSLLTLAQYQTPNEKTKIESVSFDGIVKEAIRKIEPLAQEKGISIKSKIAKTTVLGNQYHLVDLCVILLDNAIKYSKKTGSVTVRVEQKDKTSTLSVTDEGIGILTKDLPHIFDRFYRADTARTKNSRDGYGLGLAIAKKIIDTHHGMIHVTSKSGVGSTFIVTLPR